ncbi:SUMF1/EgtB/PvdO family nonheme iron enzyme [candidate division KSB1 bacterium]|nr:SUMF1/EgtB/PvdO family nonheme iron enzyme [candidate division KSB1 bacterium]
MGRTPLDSVDVQIGYLRWKIVKNGYEPIETAFGGWWPQNEDIRLDTLGAGPANMVHVPGGTYRFWSADPVELQDYWIDKYEVTNQEYKAFVDAGGYQNQAYWKEPFVMQDRTLSWEEAIALLRDKTGQPGPSTWELGSFPQGQAKYPVGGISWYEAAAYAEFAGKSLPTIYHWKKAADGRGPLQNDATVLSNLNGEGPARVGQFQGLGGFGTYDMAGNVREWCWNQSGNQRYIVGGAWNDPEWGFAVVHRLMPFDRSETNGFRCVKYTADLAQSVTNAIDPFTFSRDLTKEKPISDEVFQIYKRFFLYDTTALNAVVKSVDESMAHWRKETVTFDAAYGNERVIAQLYLPRNVVAPYQTVIYFPTSAAFSAISSDNPAEMALIDFIPRTGRALVLPVLKGMFERQDREWRSGARGFRDIFIQMVKDFRRTIDYLQTREDIDSNRLAYMGASGGGRLGPIFTAVEQRLKASVLIWGGLTPPQMGKLPDEVNPINFAPRSRVPVLMINGRYDINLPLETSQRPLFRLLGAPEKDKRHAIIAGAHVTPMNEVIKETLNWLDRYLGPVQRQVQTSKK